MTACAVSPCCEDIAQKAVEDKENKLQQIIREKNKFGASMIALEAAVSRRDEALETAEAWAQTQVA